jgi:hypothetical protein
MGNRLDHEPVRNVSLPGVMDATQIYVRTAEPLMRAVQKQSKSHQHKCVGMWYLICDAHCHVNLYVRVCVCMCMCEFVWQKGVVRIDQLATLSIFLQIIDRHRQH